MSRAARAEKPLRDPVELLLARIAFKALRGSLVTGAALAAGCVAADQADEPVAQGGGPVVGDGPDTKEQAGGGAAAAADASAISARADAGLVPPDKAEFDPCAAGPGFPVRASGLRPAESHDYVAIRQANGFFGDEAAPSDAWGARKFELINETGDACASASSTGCDEKVALHPLTFIESYCVQTCVEWSVVTTRGDEVKRWAAPEELVQLLGAIDSVDDALMIVASRAYDVSCREADGVLQEPMEAWRRSVRPVPEGYEVLATRYAETCPVLPRRYRLRVTKAGELEELEAKDFPLPMNVKACIGRVPAGLKLPRSPEQAGFAAYLARCAHLEAASVYAFERLADELTAHGAPEPLRSRARRAAADEVRHARVVTALSRAQGVEPETPEVVALRPRSLEAMATENAIEGCVRETYGALVGLHQAERAGELALRRNMHAIAADELRHAALSHDVHAWLMGQLDGAACARVRAAQRAAIDGLFAESAHEPDPELAERAGLPSARMAGSMLAELERALWAFAAEA